MLENTSTSTFQLPMDQKLSGAEIEQAILPAEVRAAYAKAAEATLDLKGDDSLGYLDLQQEAESFAQSTHAETQPRPDTPEIRVVVPCSLAEMHHIDLLFDGKRQEALVSGLFV